MNLIDRVKNIILTPAREWDVIKTETPDTGKLITGYVLPLAVAAAVAAAIGAMIGMNVLGGFRYGGSINWALYAALSKLVGAVLSVFIVAFVVDALAPTFDSEKNFGRSLQLVVYSFTPAWVGGLLAIIPILGILGGLFGLYGLYLLYLGLPKLKNTPPDKHLGYFGVTIVITIAVYMIIGWILGMLFLSIFGLSYGFRNY